MSSSLNLRILALLRNWVQSVDIQQQVDEVAAFVVSNVDPSYTIFSQFIFSELQRIVQELGAVKCIPAGLAVYAEESYHSSKTYAELLAKRMLFQYYLNVARVKHQYIQYRLTPPPGRQSSAQYEHQTKMNAQFLISYDVVPCYLDPISPSTPRTEHAYESPEPFDPTPPSAPVYTP
jgi:hypothetical protein